MGRIKAFVEEDPDLVIIVGILLIVTGLIIVALG
jgi:uncharacterized membrane protein